MRKIFFTIFICANFFLLQSLCAQKIYVKAIGIVGNGSTLFKGSSIAKGHENEIEAISYSETDSSCGFIGGGGGGSCKTATGPWIFSMSTNPSLIDFKSYMYQGKRVGRVTITFTTTGSDPFIYYTVEMNNVFVKTVSESGAAGSGKPQFYIELDPSTIEWTNIVQDPDGSSGKKTSFGWDRTKNTHL